MFAMRGIDLILTDEAFLATATLAQARNTGARGLRSILERALLDVTFEVQDGVHTVYVTEDSIHGLKPVLMLSGEETVKDLDLDLNQNNNNEEATG